MTSTPLRDALGDDFFDSLPTVPGVYLMLGARERLLYVGKAKCLRTRLRFYARVTAQDRDRKLVRMVSSVRTIRWEESPSEAEALLRESELIRSLRPPFNRAQKQFVPMFVTTRDAGRLTRFRITEAPQPDETAYGCFVLGDLAITGYCALLRLLFVAQSTKEPPQIPSKISRPFSPYPFAMHIREDWRAPLDEFLSGYRDRLVNELDAAIDESETIPDFMQLGIRRDFDTALEFYAFGPRATRQLATRGGFTGRTVPAARMRSLVRDALRARLATT
jgi:excinuclease UvrABC nuclease subunit